jgi:SanA protein
MAIFLGLMLLLLFVLLYTDNLVTKKAKGKTFSAIKEVPFTKTGLLLGTAKYLKSGHRNYYFSYRIDAATELFKSGKIKNIIISGDNSRSTYDEPTDMKNELIKNGVDSTKIYLDYAGFRTFDSVVRVKEIFSQDSILLISQLFHNERAIYIAEKKGLIAFGYNAKDVEKKYGIKTVIREKFARVKLMLDFMIGTKPKFLGEKIEIKEA